MPTGTNPIASNIDYVRRAQRVISSSPAVRDVGIYFDRPTFLEVANLIGKKYWPKTFRQNLYIGMEQIIDLYRCALILYPVYQTKLPGTYRANWTRGALLSWFRRSVGHNSRQWYFAYHRYDEQIDLEQSIRNARDICRIRDETWVHEWITWLHDMSLTEGLKSTLAQQIYLPLAFSHRDTEMRSICDYAASPTQRSKNRAKKFGSLGYLRKGRDVWMLSDRYMEATLKGKFAFVDLRKTISEVVDYTIIYVEKQQREGKSGLQIKIKMEVINDAIAEVKAILDTTATPQYKLIKINRVLADFGVTHQYATGSGSELWDLDKRVRRMVMDHIQPIWPDAKQKFYSIINRIYKDLVFPLHNPFFSDISEEVWLAIWSPWR